MEVEEHAYLHNWVDQGELDAGDTEEDAEDYEEWLRRDLEEREHGNVQGQRPAQAAAPRPQQVAQLPKIGTMPFTYNPLHDMESLMWVAFYIVLCSRMDKWDASLSDEQWASYALSRRALAAKLFNNAAYRYRVVFGGALGSALAGLHPTLRAICETLNQCLHRVSDLYKYTEKGQIQAAVDYARQLVSSGAAVFREIIPNPIPYNVALKAKLYMKLEDAFDAIAQQHQYWADEKHPIPFKPPADLLSSSDQEEEEPTLPQAGRAPMPTIVEEEDPSDDARPMKRIKLADPNFEFLDDMRRRNKVLRDAKIDRKTASSSIAAAWL